MSTNEKEATELPSPPAESERQGCAVSFLTGERNEMDKLCGGVHATHPDEYVQPDEEKETGGES